MKVAILSLLIHLGQELGQELAQPVPTMATYSSSSCHVHSTLRAQALGDYDTWQSAMEERDEVKMAESRCLF